MKSNASRKVEWMQMPGRQSEETLPCMLATTTDTELEESDPLTDVNDEKNEDELEENELILEDC